MLISNYRIYYLFSIFNSHRQSLACSHVNYSSIQINQLSLESWSISWNSEIHCQRFISLRIYTVITADHGMRQGSQPKVHNVDSMCPPAAWIRAVYRHLMGRIKCWICVCGMVRLSMHVECSDNSRHIRASMQMSDGPVSLRRDVTFIRKIKHFFNILLLLSWYRCSPTSFYEIIKLTTVHKYKKTFRYHLCESDVNQDQQQQQKNVKEVHVQSVQ